MRGLETKRVRVERREEAYDALSSEEVQEAYRELFSDIRQFPWNQPRPDDQMQRKIEEIERGAGRGGVDREQIIKALQGEAAETFLFLSATLHQSDGAGEGSSRMVSLFQSHFLPSIESPEMSGDAGGDTAADIASYGKDVLNLSESDLAHVGEDLVKTHIMSIFDRIWVGSAQDRLDSAKESIAIVREQFGITEDIEDFINSRETFKNDLRKKMMGYVVHHGGAAILQDAVATFAPREGMGAYQSVLHDALDYFYRRSSRWKDQSVKQFADTFFNGMDISEHFMQRYRDDVAHWQWESIIDLRNANRETQSILDDALEEQGRIATDANASSLDRLQAVTVLSKANEKLGGISNVIEDLAKVVHESGQSDDPDSLWGLGPAQESALLVLLQSPIMDASEALAEMLSFKRLDPVVRHAIIRKLLNEENEWLSDSGRVFVRAWFENQPEKDIDWRDVQFMDFLYNNSDDQIAVLNKSTESFALLKDFDFTAFPLYKRWGNQYRDIPKRTFMQMVAFAHISGEYRVLDIFQNLFANGLRAETADAVFRSFVDVLHTDRSVVRVLGEKLRQVTLETESDVEHLMDIFNSIAFLDTSTQSLKENAVQIYGNANERQSILEAVDASFTAEHLISSESQNLEDLARLVDESTRQFVQRVLSHPDIDTDRAMTLFDSWGNLEPVFTYLGKFPNMRKYITDIVAHTDSQENWKSWRYSAERNQEIIEDQIGHLSEEQLNLWKTDQVIDVGDVVLSAGAAKKSEKIYHLLQDAVLRDKHIYNEDAGVPDTEGVAEKHIQTVIETVLQKTEEDPDGKDVIITETLERIQNDANAIDTITKYHAIPSLRQWISILSEETKPGSKMKNIVNRVKQFLPADLRKEIQVRYNVLERGVSMTVLTDSMRQAIDASVQQVEQQYASALSSDLFERYGFDTEVKNRQQFYEKREEVRVIENILKLLTLTGEKIANNRISNGLSEETIKTVIDRLKNYFGKKKGSGDHAAQTGSFGHVLENIESVLKEGTEIGRKHRLGILFTDDPRVLWRTGKYPTGGLSCLQYDVKNMNSKSLMGFVGDPNCKVMYAVDLTAFSEERWDRVKREGIKNADILPILEASVSRSAVKVVRDAEGKDPAVLIEPEYSSYGVDVSAFFDLFVQSMVSNRMNVPVMREGGVEKVVLGKSLSPEGRYDDTNPNTVRFVNRPAA